MSGVSLGDFLIKRVVDELRQELPELKVFSTLSPIPGFSDWLDKNEVKATINEENKSALSVVTDKSFQELLGSRDWLQDEEICAAMHAPLKALAALYITREKRDIRVADAVAHFHLSNGAIVERINWMADTSARGKKQSYTLMVNYLYDLSQIESNHEDYIGKGIVAQSKDVDSLSGD